MKQIIYTFYLITICILTGIVSCCSPKNTTSTPNAAVKPNVIDYEKEGYVRATVIKYEVDGCQYLFQLSSGKKLEVQKFPEELKLDKKQVWIKFELDKNAASTCMAGDIVKLTNYQMIQ